VVTTCSQHDDDELEDDSLVHLLKSAKRVAADRENPARIPVANPSGVVQDAPYPRFIMNTRCLLVLLSLALPAWSEEPANPQAQAEQYYRQGMAAVKAGQVEQAREAFSNALRLNPNHGNARYQLLELRQGGGALAGKARERKLAAVTIPEVNFEEITLQEALEGLDLLVQKHSPDKFTANFIVQDPGKQFAKHKLTIRLRNVPASAVLKYALEQAQGTAKYDEHAIVIRPQPAGGAGEQGKL
jgi:tetratricopeptide (TPR) repeat protein